ncbi:hypothetical protein PFICI_13991 [Pestalotiopsis fici W106-1]|uniref:trans-L-3-hydroxyproline dehydratase n=1 Tax=Pestalotiopsis fici (strain W106-1 / CGMCC3.15140) TaxID=1229662 RepID=W3WJL9_PESFW|nr:uncharacterized protein PFICI_13991 [Pestalotiopsis fici W106-1]ETS74125.1 hypothetical protein PFICI_13991 [Pestalotiopsis fici W106-1]
MDPSAMLPPGLPLIHCVEMHTSGEPTRIIYNGFPKLTGTLLEQRAQAQKEYSHLRRRIMLEPRGHDDMYGAILCRDTELTQSGEADMGVLFMHNEGFSTMCGHATIALGRFIVDNQFNTEILPSERSLRYDAETKTTLVRLHAPCGMVEIQVPSLGEGQRADTTRLVSFTSVKSFATGLNITIEISPEFRWPQLGQRTSVTADFSYGGAFYCLITPEELGFPAGLAEPNKSQMGFATTMLKAAANSRPELRKYFQHPDATELGFLYSIMLVERIGASSDDAQNSVGEETGLCFFANQQIDRSPTGGAVAARVALAHAQGHRNTGERWRYQSLLSRHHGGLGSFAGTIIDKGHLPAKDDGKEPISFVRVKVEGSAHYSGYHAFVSEDEDVIGRNGFSLIDMGL